MLKYEEFPDDSVVCLHSKAEFFEATIFPGRQQEHFYNLSIANRPEKIESFLIYTVRRSLCDRLIVMVFLPYSDPAQHTLVLSANRSDPGSAQRPVSARPCGPDPLPGSGGTDADARCLHRRGAEVLNNVLDSLLCEPAVRILEPHKQRWIVIGPASEVTPEIFSADLG